jgi:metal-sulfur cluster biosynthetic enzyme
VIDPLLTISNRKIQIVPKPLDIIQHVVCHRLSLLICNSYIWFAEKLMVMSQDIQQTRRQIFDELTRIVDPEIGVSIMELELVDKVDIDSGKVNIDLHLTSPFCPAVFGFKIAQDVRDNVYRLPGIEAVKVNVSNHFMADAINKQVNESTPPTKA